MASSSNPCKFFQRGYCRYGSRCKLSHSSARGGARWKPVGAALSSLEIEGWLEGFLRRTSAANIQELSSPQGLKILCDVVAMQLSRKAADLLAALLSKDEMRRSMPREETNKIYGSVAESRFVLQLQVHMNNRLPRTDESLKPYLLLIEELQLRVSDGWKYLPLDAAEQMIQELPQTRLKHELADKLDVLLEHRRKLRLQMTATDTSWEMDFRCMSLIPGKEELLRLTDPGLLPVNKVGLGYTSVSEYLETHFRLLREDFIEPLRHGIKQYVSKQGGCSRSSEVRIYTNVQFRGLSLTFNGIESKVSYFAGRGRNIDCSKQLIFGSLLCLSKDNFETITWATVAGGNGWNVLSLRLIDGSDELDPSGKYVMVEAVSAYFEAYCHVLKILRMLEMETMPFQRQLISLEKNVKEPAYLMSRAAKDSYDFSSTFPEIARDIGRSSFHILKAWPEWQSTLDSSQRAVLKHALTKNLAVIQGPPGTGKTFIGLLIVQLLLANLTRKAPAPLYSRSGSAATKIEPAPYVSGPVLIVCYTNHALDQFLEGVYRFEKKVIRVGSRGESEVLKDRTLHALVKQARQSRKVEHSLVLASKLAEEERQTLETDLDRFVQDRSAVYVTESRLHGIATGRQIQSLFEPKRAASATSEEVVQAWLRGGSFRTDHERKNNDLAERVTNRFALLMGGPGSQGSTCSSDVSEIDEFSSSSWDDDSDYSEAQCVDSVEGSDVDRYIENYSTATDGEDSDADASQSSDVNLEADQQDIDLLDAQQEAYELGGDANSILPDVDVVELPLLELVNQPDLWSLPQRERQRLHRHWLDEIHANAQRQFTICSQEYEAACRSRRNAYNEIQLSLLRKAKVIGMTTTAAARMREILATLRPEILVVEEAAEVLESHVLACISPHTKHLILIGDHQQLRPSVATFELAQKHKLDVSMFERLVTGGVEHTMLTTQRRMKPSISKLISSIYPELENHTSVFKYDDVKGVKSSVFFLDHDSPEEGGRAAGSKVNVAEARLVVEFCSYLLKQNIYAPKDITILAMYKGQVEEISRRLKDCLLNQFRGPVTPAAEMSEANWIPRVSSVDGYQGEENDIILLSLVRNNLISGNEEASTIGFLKTSNRVCVALSRARKGLYIFGNAQLLALKSPLWEGIVHQLGQDGHIGSKLVLCCQNHPHVETAVQSPEDFHRVSEGGCNRPCEYQLECGHACVKKCHPGSHDEVICPKNCLKQYDGCSHLCTSSCHGKDGSPCPPCMAAVRKSFPICGHDQMMPCSKDPGEAICMSPCQKLVSCGHVCLNRCGEPCTVSCDRLVRRELACGHSASMRCSQDPLCGEPCNEILPCKHNCGGTCGKCDAAAGMHVSCQQPCGKGLFCGHQCVGKCSDLCPPCSQRCQQRCVHKKCAASCGAPCKQCLEPCSWRCRHFKCSTLCHEICERPRCDKRCRKKLACRHRCIGLCGERCPKACRICHPNTLEAFTQRPLEQYEVTDRFIELRDCGHLFEVTGLDQWMGDGQSAPASTPSEEVGRKSCPVCKTPIWRTFGRYSNVIKRNLQQIELAKTGKMLVYSVWRIRSETSR